MVVMFKTLLIWLCMLSLPIQGMAAVTMASCKAVHHQQSKHQHEHHAMGEHHAGGDPHHSVADKCSACASCCIGTAMVTPVLHWQGTMVEPSPLVAAVKVLRPSFHPDGFERPPRSLIA
jgi:hypothetical protein